MLNSVNVMTLVAVALSWPPDPVFPRSLTTAVIVSEPATPSPLWYDTCWRASFNSAIVPRISIELLSVPGVTVSPATLSAVKDSNDTEVAQLMVTLTVPVLSLSSAIENAGIGSDTPVRTVASSDDA